MKPESDHERSEREAIARRYREASVALDERPDASVRAAVLAAAARAVGAKPHDAARSAASGRASKRPLAARRWPLSAAALLIVSIMTGLVASHGWWERPDLVDANQARLEMPRVAVPAAPAPAAPQQAEVQKREAPTADAHGAGMIAAENDAADKSTGTTREPAMRAAPPRRDAVAPAQAGAQFDSRGRVTNLAPDLRRKDGGHASPKQDAVPTPEVPSAARPDLAGELRSNPAQPKSETASSDAAPAPSAPAAVQRSHSPGADKPALTSGRATSIDEPGARTGAPSSVEHESPDAWVARIVKLRETGDDDEADREVARLKRRYPEFTIPREALRVTGTR